MFTKLAIWYLIRKNKSVVINMIVQPYLIQSKQSETYLHNNVITDMTFLDYNDNVIVIPDGKFKIRH